TDIIEKAKYLKWKSVIEKKQFRESDVFRGLELSGLAKEAMAVALDDILKAHTLAYIGYPERATIRNKIMRVLFGIAILPVRLFLSFKEWLRRLILNLFQIFQSKEIPREEEPSRDDSESGSPQVTEDDS
ncbi:MAG: hypothetical protein ACW97O_05745, partial [Candidatus Thorarchaeota archaeon]